MRPFCQITFNTCYYHHRRHRLVIIISPAGTVANYCDGQTDRQTDGSLSQTDRRESVCLSVRQAISGTTRAIFINFCVHIAHVRGSVLLRHVDDRPHRLSARMGFLPH